MKKDLPKAEFKFNPYLKDLPEHLKDPKCFYKVRKLLLEVLGGKHSHSEMDKWANCKQCMDNMRNLIKARKKLGFTSGEQYYSWHKTMEFIHKKLGQELNKPIKYMR